MKIGGQFHNFITKAYPEGVSFTFHTKRDDDIEEEIGQFVLDAKLNSSDIYEQKYTNIV